VAARSPPRIRCAAHRAPARAVSVYSRRFVRVPPYIRPAARIPPRGRGGGGQMRRGLPARWRSGGRPQAAAHTEPLAETARDARDRVRVAALLGSGGYLVFLALELSGVHGHGAREHALNVGHDVAGSVLCASLLAITLLRA